MKSALRASSLLGGSWLLTLVVAVIGGKVRSTLLEPEGFGFFAVLQNIVTIGGLVFGLGVGTALIRCLPPGIAETDPRLAHALRRAARILPLVTVGLSSVVLLEIAGPLEHLFASGDRYRGGTALLSLAIGFGVAFDVEVGVLVAHRRLARAAKLGVISALLGTAAGLFVLALYGRSAVPWAIVANAAVTWVTAAAMGWSRDPERVQPSARELRRASRELLRFGTPYAASQAVGLGAQLAIPLLAGIMLGAHAAGLYQAAAAIAGTYLGFLGAAMARDYYSRLIARPTDPAELMRLINEQQRVVLVIAPPVIFATLCVIPYLIPLLFTTAFTPASEVLNWMLLGDLFLFTSWSLAFAVLATSGRWVYFLVELAGGAIHLVAAWFGGLLLGLQGLGLSWVLTNAVYLLLVWGILRRQIRFQWNRGVLVTMGAVLVAAALVRAASYSNVEPIRLVVTASAAIAAVLYSAHVLRELVPSGARQLWRGATQVHTASEATLAERRPLP